MEGRFPHLGAAVAASLVIVAAATSASASGIDTEPGDGTCRQVEYIGRAFSLESGELLYTEEHRETRCGDRHVHSRVTYRNAAGDTMITKLVDFSRFPATPDMRSEDWRTGYVEAAAVKGDSLILQRRADAAADLERKALALDGPAVVDAGFDQAVRQSWDRLVAGKRVEVDFAVPDKLRDFRFRIRRLGDGDPGDVLRLRIEPASFLLRWIAPHIDLAYSTADRRLRTYEGITNVPSPEGPRYRARVEFDYPPSSATVLVPPPDLGSPTL